jgi:hypothetical protein
VCSSAGGGAQSEIGVRDLIGERVADGVLVRQILLYCLAVHALHGHIAPLGGVLEQGPARGGDADVRRQAVLLKVYEPGVVFAQVLGAHFDDSVGGQHAELGVLTPTVPVFKACFFDSASGIVAAVVVVVVVVAMVAVVLTVQVVVMVLVAVVVMEFSVLCDYSRECCLQEPKDVVGVRMTASRSGDLALAC